MAWNSTVLSPFCSRGQKSFTRLKPWCLGKNAFPWLFQLLEATCVPWFLAPSSIFRMHHSRLFSHHHTLFLSAVSLPLGKDLCDYIGPTPKSLITPAKSLLPYEVNFTGSGLGMDGSGGLFSWHRQEPLGWTHTDSLGKGGRRGRPDKEGIAHHHGPLLSQAVSQAEPLQPRPDLRWLVSQCQPPWRESGSLWGTIYQPCRASNSAERWAMSTSTFPPNHAELWRLGRCYEEFRAREVGGEMPNGGQRTWGCWDDWKEGPNGPMLGG